MPHNRQFLSPAPTAPVSQEQVFAPYGIQALQDDPELAMAGARAHNRWLADLCAASPDRRGGIATVPIIHDVAAGVGPSGLVPRKQRDRHPEGRPDEGLASLHVDEQAHPHRR